jgi:hypothetical protein
MVNPIAQFGGLTQHQIDKARFPALYQAARKALQECARLDEVKEQANKWDALAMYAKQSQNKDLLDLARRIQLRAERRIGEILKTIPDQAGAGRAAHGPSRWSEAKKAGLASDTTRRALAFAGMPEGAFEALLEEEEVPSPRKVFEKISINLPKRIPRTRTVDRRVVMRTFREFDEFMKSHPVADIAATLTPPDAREAMIAISKRLVERLRFLGAALERAHS